MESSIREKVFAAPDKVYCTRIYQYFVGYDGRLYRCRREDLDTTNLVVELVEEE